MCISCNTYINIYARFYLSTKSLSFFPKMAQSVVGVDNDLRCHKQIPLHGLLFIPFLQHLCVMFHFPLTRLNTFVFMLYISLRVPTARGEDPEGKQKCC